MRISQLFQQPQAVISFEVFPPKRDGDLAALYRVLDEVSPLQPSFVSVTYGAGGSNSGLHFEINAHLQKKGITALPHFTCVGHGKAAIQEQLDRLRDAGVENILALRGDPPKGAEKFEKPSDGFGHASELIAFIKSRYNFCVGAACYPEGHSEAISLEDDLRQLKHKVDQGVDFLVTQMFFDNQAYWDFVTKARVLGVQVPILPGIMPVTTAKFFNRDFGVRYPLGFRDGFEGVDEATAKQHGLAFAARQAGQLLAQGAPGLHLYMMNKAENAQHIMHSLGA